MVDCHEVLTLRNKSNSSIGKEWSRELLESTTIALLMVCVGSLFSSADAACTNGPTNYNSAVACSNAGASNLTMTGPSTVTITNSGGAQTGILAEVTGNTASVTATINDTTVINNNATSPSLGIYVHVASGSATGNGTLTMSRANSVTTANGTAILVNVLGSGNATINISGTIDVTSLQTNADDRDGIEATIHGGHATVNMMDATGTVSVKGGNGILIDSLSAGGIITGNIGSGITINLDNTIAGANNALRPNSGIYATTLGNGTVDLITGGYRQYGWGPRGRYSNKCSERIYQCHQFWKPHDKQQQQ